MKRVSIPGAGCELSVLTTGTPEADPVVVLHGMRDHAVSMAYLAEHLPEHRLFVPDLRGHGDSDSPGSYSAVQMVADVKALQEHFNLQQMHLIGHSLGGHIASRFSVLYPDLVASLIMLDGMGPPEYPVHSPDDRVLWRNEAWREVIDSLLEHDRPSRVMADVEEALTRFRKNNPGLSEERARLFVETGTRTVDGGLRWKFDTGLEMFWLGQSMIENEASLWRIHCPVLIVTGEHALDYWSAHQPLLKGQQALYESELERRRRLYINARHEVIPGAGHMLHYDQPEALANLIRNFLMR